MKILVVEDEPDLAEVLVEALEEERYLVDLARDGEKADEMMGMNEYDAVVLDWTIPAPDGLELLRTWRKGGVETPVLMLTGRSRLEDRVGGLDTGADDYLTKPFSLAELLARVRTLLRRRDRSLNAMEAGDLKMDRPARKVIVAGREVVLSPKEFAILEYLLTRVDEVVTRTELAEHAWDDSFDAMSNVIDVTVYRLRKKIDGGNPLRLLHTLKGVGYSLKSQRA
ncbi:MAG: response regulator transcription factor [Deltaproteobacteria bacterium]|nr:response regulator transcription factor [Deltaproteobacteria bacterium]